MRSRMEIMDTEDGIRFTGLISRLDVVKVRLDAVDRAIIEDCGKPDRSISDWLMALGIIFKRMEEQDETET